MAIVSTPVIRKSTASADVWFNEPVFDKLIAPPGSMSSAIRAGAPNVFKGRKFSEVKVTIDFAAVEAAFEGR
jgi:hypothetical protein